MAISRLLVANRGEIACRIFRTCERLGVDTVAVAEPTDRGSLHARSAAQTVEISSYLDPEAVIDAAREAQADGVHPGYGFLAESPELAEAVTAAGLIWVGPSPQAMRLGGDKVSASAIAREAGVAIAPQGSPDEMPLPFVVKAAAGGGGRGMRVVRTRAETDTAIADASREAEAAFGDGTVFCEPYRERARHVEAQLLGHSDGVVVLGLRDCSLQRRHQKVIEEAPPPILDARAELAIRAGAEAFATAIGYRSLGTAEFLVDGSEAYFLELNARIQVEHPVTEALTGLDLVELQLRIAAGDPVSVGVHEKGHAIEARLYAEDARTFLPRSGVIERLVLPDTIRVDTGVEAGDEVGLRYDPLLAKLVAHGATRDEARAMLEEALAQTVVSGVGTNLDFLRWAVGHPTFREGAVSTAFLIDHPPLSTPPRRRSRGSWSTAWRLNRPPPAPTSPPDIEATAGDHRRGDGTVRSLMPGTVIAVDVAARDEVAAHARLLVLEAMKMEHQVSAPFAGRIAEVLVAVGDAVPAGATLVVFDASDEEPDA
jgi:acetyl-CoA/propionyl-CoA carboxylase, biotin carboxylase, biotin carboxyl carrier protein